VEIRHCSELREVALENNRLATPVLDLRALAQLRALQLFGNPLEFLPELSPCTALRYLSLANVRPAPAALARRPSLTLRTLHFTPRVACGMLFAIAAPLRACRPGSRASYMTWQYDLRASRCHARAACMAATHMLPLATGCNRFPPSTNLPSWAAQVRMRADACFTQWDVEFAAAATFSRASRLAPLFGLVFRRSSCQHPLLAGALGAARACGAGRAACGSRPWV